PGLDRQPPEQRQRDQQRAYPELSSESFGETRLHPWGTGLGSSSGGGHEAFAASRISHSSRTAPRPAGRFETQCTSRTTSGAASLGQQEKATFRKAGKSLTSSPMKADSDGGMPTSAQICSMAAPFARLCPTTCSIDSSLHRCMTKSARRPVSTASFTPPNICKSRNP